MVAITLPKQHNRKNKNFCYMGSSIFVLQNVRNNNYINEIKEKKSMKKFYLLMLSVAVAMAVTAISASEVSTISISSTTPKFRSAWHSSWSSS